MPCLKWTQCWFVRLFSGQNSHLAGQIMFHPHVCDHVILTGELILNILQETVQQIYDE